MALDATVAGTAADTYATLDDATAYVAQVASSTWNALADAAQENYLRRATRLVDRYSWDSWKYDLTTVAAGQQPGQKRQFPRAIDVDGNGDPFIPAEAVECCCAVAVALSEGVSETSTGDAAIKVLKAGSMRVEFETDDETDSATSADEIICEILGHRIARCVRTI